MPRQPKPLPRLAQFTCDIKWPNGAVVPQIFHPVTGQLLDPGQDPTSGDEPDWGQVTETDYAAIPGLLFVFIGVVREFAWLHPDIEARLEGLRETHAEDEDEPDDFELLERYFAGMAKVPFAYCLTTQGMACGPVSSSVWYGFDLFAPYAGFYEG